MSYCVLQGVRVLDLGIITAGASTSAILADLGAEVIKIEGPGYTDPFRAWTFRGAGDWWNQSPQFHATNRSKQSLCVDLKSDEGRELFLRLVEVSDIVVENFRVGVLDSLGISYAAMCTRKPDIVLASISSQGQTGPLASQVSLGSTLEASSGFAALYAQENGPPHVTGKALNYPDQVVSLFAAGAILSAVVQRQATGAGVHLDISQREVAAFLVGEALIAQANGKHETPVTGRCAAWIEGVFNAGDGQQVAISVASAQARTVAAFIGVPSATTATLGAWVQSRAAPDAARALRAMGIASEVVVRSQDFDDPHAMQPVHAFARDDAGRQVKGLPLRLGDSDVAHYGAAAPLGTHNEDICQRLLGLAPAECARLVLQGVLAQRPTSTST